MKLAVLFSGGKDSCAALALAQSYGHEIACLLNIQSENPDSYMFHTPNRERVELQAKAIGIPLISQTTRGEKEEELEELILLFKKAKEKLGIKGLVTGAIESVYQASRIQRICNDLGLVCFNPLWQRDALEHVDWLLKHHFEVFISGIAAYPLDASWLGKKIDYGLLAKLQKLRDEHNVSPAGEGGEFETFVTHGPAWKKRIVVEETTTEYENHAGRWNITKASLVDAPIISSSLGNINKTENNAGNVLIISTCAESLHELEFVTPIVRALEVPCRVVHHLDVLADYLGTCERVIICGTALSDDKFLKKSEEFSWLKSFDKPVLGICAGYQLIALVHGGETYAQMDIGMQDLGLQWTLGEVKEAYFLHHNNVGVPEGFLALEHNDQPILIEKNNMLGVLFHPEVRNRSVIKNFLEF